MPAPQRGKERTEVGRGHAMSAAPAPPPASWDALPTEIQDRIMAERTVQMYEAARYALRQRCRGRELRARGHTGVTKCQLQALCGERGIPTSGTKGALLDRLDMLDVRVSFPARDKEVDHFCNTMERIDSEADASYCFWLGCRPPPP